MTYRLLTIITILILIIPPSSAVFSLTGEPPSEPLIPGERISYNASVLLLPEGQPFPADHALVISGDLDDQIFTIQVFADTTPQKRWNNKEGAAFINGQFLSYKVSPDSDHQYRGSSVRIEIESEGTVPADAGEKLSLIEVIELDNKGRMEYDGFDSIQAGVYQSPEKSNNNQQNQTPNPPPEQKAKETPSDLILLIGAWIAAVILIPKQNR